LCSRLFKKPPPSLGFERIDVKTRAGRALGDELLVMLKDDAGLPYSEIIKYPPFQPLKYSSLPKLYKRAKIAAHDS